VQAWMVAVVVAAVVVAAVADFWDDAKSQTKTLIA